MRETSCVPVSPGDVYFDVDQSVSDAAEEGADCEPLDAPISDAEHPTRHKVTIEAGEDHVNVIVTPKPDGAVDSDKTLRVALASDPNPSDGGASPHYVLAMIGSQFADVVVHGSVPSPSGPGHLDVLKVSHNVPGDPLTDREKQTVGAFVPMNNDDDDYSLQGTNFGEDWKQTGAIQGEDDLLPIVLRPIAGDAGFYSLGFNGNLRIWRNADRSGESVKHTDEFPDSGETILYVEGIETGVASIELNWHDAAVPSHKVDSAKVTVFRWLGPLNVPGNSTDLYTTVGAPKGAKWIDGTNGTVVAKADVKAPMDNAEIKWSGGPEVAQNVSKAVFQVNDSYTWDLEVNVVQVVVEKPDAGDAFKAGSGVEGGVAANAVVGPVKHVSSAGGANNDGLHWAAKVSLNGPTRAGKADCGVSQIRVGFVQNATLTKFRATYAGVNRARVNKLEGQTLFDADPKAKPPYFSRAAGATFLNPSPETKSATIEFQDTPSAEIPVRFDKTVVDSKLINHLDLLFDFVLFVVASTTDSRNKAADIYTSEARANWQWDASQDIGGSPNFAWNALNSKVTPPADGKWQTDSSGTRPKIDGPVGNTVYLNLMNWN